MKILILAYEFPPLISIGGLRPYYWSKYWSENSDDVVVVTRHWSEKVNTPEDYVRQTNTATVFEAPQPKLKIIRTPYYPNLRDKLLLKFGFYGASFMRKILSLAYSYLEWFFLSFDVKSEIYYGAKKQLDKQSFDLIIATGQPFILFRYASLLSAKFNVPWVADYRDGWTSAQGDYVLTGLQKHQHSFFRKMELKTLQSACFISTAAPPYKEELQKLFPSKEIEVTYNGFDDTVLAEIADIQPRKDKFVIAYIGMLYMHQKLETFLQAIKELLAEGLIQEHEIEIIFYATNAFPDSKKRLLEFDANVAKVITTTDRTPYRQLMAKLKEAHLLLLLSKKKANWLNTKLFDYFAVSRPVLLVENDEGVLNNLIQETDCGFSANNTQDAKNIILDLFTQFKKGSLSNNAIHAKCLNYTRKNQALLFQNVIHQKINAERQ